MADLYTAVLASEHGLARPHLCAPLTAEVVPAVVRSRPVGTPIVAEARVALGRERHAAAACSLLTRKAAVRM